MFIKSFKKVIFFLFLFAIITCIPTTIFADSSSDIIIKETDSEEFPEINLYINFVEGSKLGSQDLKKEDFRVFENGQEIEEINPERIAVISEPIGVVLAIDTSGSMKGDPIIDAKNAALIFMNEMRSVDEFAIIGFADEVTTYSNFTTDRQKLAEAIAEIEAKGETSLFDGIYMSLNKFKERQDLRYKYVIVLSDGTDTVSKLSAFANARRPAHMAHEGSQKQGGHYQHNGRGRGRVQMIAEINAGKAGDGDHRNRRCQHGTKSPRHQKRCRARADQKGDGQYDASGLERADNGQRQDGQ